MTFLPPVGQDVHKTQPANPTDSISPVLPSNFTLLPPTLGEAQNSFIQAPSGPFAPVSQTPIISESNPSLVISPIPHLEGAPMARSMTQVRSEVQARAVAGKVQISSPNIVRETVLLDDRIARLYKRLCEQKANLPATLEERKDFHATLEELTRIANCSIYGESTEAYLPGTRDLIFRKLPLSTEDRQALVFFILQEQADWLKGHPNEKDPIFLSGVTAALDLCRHEISTAAPYQAVFLRAKLYRLTELMPPEERGKASVELAASIQTGLNFYAEPNALINMPPPLRMQAYIRLAKTAQECGMADLVGVFLQQAQRISERFLAGPQRAQHRVDLLQALKDLGMDGEINTLVKAWIEEAQAGAFVVEEWTKLAYQLAGMGHLPQALDAFDLFHHKVLRLPVQQQAQFLPPLLKLIETLHEEAYANQDPQTAFATVKLDLLCKEIQNTHLSSDSKMPVVEQAKLWICIAQAASLSEDALKALNHVQRLCKSLSLRDQLDLYTAQGQVLLDLKVRYSGDPEQLNQIKRAVGSFASQWKSRFEQILETGPAPGFEDAGKPQEFKIDLLVSLSSFCEQAGEGIIKDESGNEAEVSLAAWGAAEHRSIGDYLSRELVGASLETLMSKAGLLLQPGTATYNPLGAAALLKMVRKEAIAQISLEDRSDLELKIVGLISEARAALGQLRLASPKDLRLSGALNDLNDLWIVMWEQVGVDAQESLRRLSSSLLVLSEPTETPLGLLSKAMVLAAHGKHEQAENIFQKIQQNSYSDQHPFVEKARAMAEFYTRQFSIERITRDVCVIRASIASQRLKEKSFGNQVALQSTEDALENFLGGLSRLKTVPKDFMAALKAVGEQDPSTASKLTGYLREIGALDLIESLGNLGSDEGVRRAFKGLQALFDGDVSFSGNGSLAAAANVVADLLLQHAKSSQLIGALKEFQSKLPTRTESGEFVRGLPNLAIMMAVAYGTGTMAVHVAKWAVMGVEAALGTGLAGSAASTVAGNLAFASTLWATNFPLNGSSNLQTILFDTLVARLFLTPTRAWTGRGVNIARGILGTPAMTFAGMARTQIHKTAPELRLAHDGENPLTLFSVLNNLCLCLGVETGPTVLKGGSLAAARATRRILADPRVQQALGSGPAKLLRAAFFAPGLWLMGAGAGDMGGSRRIGSGPQAPTQDLVAVSDQFIIQVLENHPAIRELFGPDHYWEAATHFARMYATYPWLEVGAYHTIGNPPTPTFVRYTPDMLRGAGMREAFGLHRNVLNVVYPRAVGGGTSTQVTSGPFAALNHIWGLREAFLQSAEGQPAPSQAAPTGGMPQFPVGSRVSVRVGQNLYETRSVGPSSQPAYIEIGRETLAVSGRRDINVSSRHAVLVISESGMFVVDVGNDNGGSMNGTSVNGRRIDPGVHVPVIEGSIIGFGPQTRAKVVARGGGIFDLEIISTQEGPVAVPVSKPAPSAPQPAVIPPPAPQQLPRTPPPTPPVSPTFDGKTLTVNGAQEVRLGTGNNGHEPQEIASGVYRVALAPTGPWGLRWLLKPKDGAKLSHDGRVWRLDQTSNSPGNVRVVGPGGKDLHLAKDEQKTAVNSGDSITMYGRTLSFKSK